MTAKKPAASTAKKPTKKPVKKPSGKLNSVSADTSIAVAAPQMTKVTGQTVVKAAKQAGEPLFAAPRTGKSHTPDTAVSILQNRFNLRGYPAADLIYAGGLREQSVTAVLLYELLQEIKGLRADLATKGGA